MNSVKLKVGRTDSSTYQGQTFFLSGFIIIQDEMISSPDELVSLLKRKKINKLDLLNSALSGEFLLIIREKNKCTVMTDIIRSKAAFIVKSGESFVVTDDLQKITDKKVDNEQISNFIGTYCLFGSNNCYKWVYTCQAGEIVTIENEQIQSKRYFEFIPEPNSKKMEVGQFVPTFKSLMKQSIEQMMASAPEVNNWVVPLSGGHDSRFIVNSLKKAGVENVICFSYGTPGNPQSAVSKQVADAVGYDWHFIEYTEEKWDKLHKNGMIDAYVDYSFQGVSTPHLQDFLAIYELQDKGIITSGDIFVPGHALCFIAGAHLQAEDVNIDTKSASVQTVINQFLNYQDNQTFEETVSDIYDQFGGTPSQFREYINWQESQSKFIVNSVRAYEFFGYDYRLPYWDRRLVNFLLTLAPEDRINRNLYKRADRQGILWERLANIPFADELNHQSSLQDFKEHLKAYIPNFLAILLLRLSQKKQNLAEGMNLIYAQHSNTVEEIIAPVKDYPRDTHSWLEPDLKRYPYQINAHRLSNLYAVRKAYNKNAL